VLGQAGHWIHVDPADPRGQRLIASGGSLNPPSLAAWRLLLAEPGWTHVIDIGANYGEMLVNVGLPPGAAVIAAEPSPAVRARLARTLREAGIAADILDAALSDTEGTARLRIDPSWSGTTRLARPEEVAGMAVPVTTLGAVLRGAGLALPSLRAVVKIDVEGHEAAVLRGAMAELPALGGFAALVEVLHATPATLAWIERHFHIEMLRLDEVPALVAVPSGRFTAMLGCRALYRQDVVLRRRAGAGP